MRQTFVEGESVRYTAAAREYFKHEPDYWMTKKVAAVINDNAIEGRQIIRLEDSFGWISNSMLEPIGPQFLM